MSGAKQVGAEIVPIHKGDPPTRCHASRSIIYPTVTTPYIHPPKVKLKTALSHTSNPRKQHLSQRTHALFVGFRPTPPRYGVSRGVIWGRCGGLYKTATRMATGGGVPLMYRTGGLA